MDLRFTATLWEYQGESPWVFATLPNEVAGEIESRVPEKGGFGSVKVEVTLGNSVWRTSLFPDRESGSFVLPVKKEIREAEGVGIGDEAEVNLDLITN